VPDNVAGCVMKTRVRMDRKIVHPLYRRLHIDDKTVFCPAILRVDAHETNRSQKNTAQRRERKFIVLCDIQSFIYQNVHGATA
jgi:hypothetical protein